MLAPSGSISVSPVFSVSLAASPRLYHSSSPRRVADSIDLCLFAVAPVRWPPVSVCLCALCVRCLGPSLPLIELVCFAWRRLCKKLIAPVGGEECDVWSQAGQGRFRWVPALWVNDRRKGEALFSDYLNVCGGDARCVAPYAPLARPNLAVGGELQGMGVRLF